MKKIFLILVFFIISCSEEPKERSSVMSLSVSSDGQYVLSAHHGRYLVLWDIANKSKKILSKDANIYSAHFIRHSHQFIWQDITKNRLHLSNIDGKELKVIKLNYPSYGHIGSKNLKNYVYSTNLWQLRQIKDNQEKKIKHGIGGLESYGKLFNLSIDDSERYLITSGDTYTDGQDLPLSAGLTAKEVNPKMPESRNYSLLNGVVLWDFKTGEPLRKFVGNSVKTYATLSPDGRYVVAGDEGGSLFAWNANTGERIYSRGASFKHGIYINDDTRDKSQLINVPKDFCQDIPNYRCIYHEASFAVKFINPTQYLRFITYVPYAVLYDVESPWPKKYLHLDGENPDVYGYIESARVDTAPDKGILVMASTTTSGILVYQYNKNDKTLKLIWSPDGPPLHKPIKNPKQHDL